MILYVCVLETCRIYTKGFHSRGGSVLVAYMFEKQKMILDNYLGVKLP